MAIGATLLSPAVASAVTNDTYPTGERPGAVAIADLDGDGINDLVVASRGTEQTYPYVGYVSVYRGTGTGDFEPRADVPGALGGATVAAGDLDGDGDVDVVVGQTYQKVEYLINDGAGALTPSGTHTVASRDVKDLALADVNGDGLLDLLAGGQDPFSTTGDHLTVSVNAGVNGDGTFSGFLPSTSVLLGQDHWALSLATGDLDGDGDKDVVVGSAASFVDVAINDGSGGFTVSHITTTPTYAAPGLPNIVPLSISSVDVGDIDEDGNQDIAVAFTNDTRHSMWILPGNGDGTFDPEVRYSFGDGVIALAIGDIDGDSHPDVAAAATENPFLSAQRLFVIDRRSGPGFPTTGYDTYQVGNSPIDVTVGRLNADPAGDIVTVNRRSDSLNVLVSEPPPSLPPTVTVTTPPDGATYSVGQEVIADFRCEDDSAVVDCIGTVDDGTAIDTSAVGIYTFEVTGTDDEGLSTTVTNSYTVKASDADAPTIVIASPIDGSRYQQDEVAFADFICDDGAGSGISLCAGDIPQGELLDTSSVGNHSFTVTAEDQAGNSSTKTVSYEVLASGDTDAPQIWISQPSDGDSYEVGQVVLASYSCDDLGGSGLATCEGPVASEEPLDTTTAGTHTFRVTASDHAGNTSSLSVSYLVRDLSPPPADVYAPYPVIRVPLFKQRYATGSHVEVDYECFDLGPSPSGIASCTGSLADGATLDTTTPGTYSFAAIATDRAGNSSSRTVTYEVIDDSDGDGLSDLWETEGIDVDNDGQVDLRLDQPPYNADPEHKDMFVETDWMECGLAPSTCAPSDQLSHKPAPGVADSVVAAFASAPLSNPDGTDGVRLHLDIDQAVPEISVLNFNAFPRPSGSYDDYDDIKLGGPGPCNGAFGTAAERSSTDCEDVLAAKSLVYRYGLWAHHHSQWIGSSGLGEYPGNDFIVTVGGSYSSWDSLPGGIASIETATLMHELGHTLGLGHGGPNRDDTNCKPNYLSVMNYAFQSTDYYPNRPLDYSRQQLPTLDESALVESDGISGPAGYKTVFGLNGVRRLVSANGPIDWNGDGDTNDTVAADPSRLEYSCGRTPGELLKGGDDWRNLLWSFVASPDNASGAHFTSDTLATSELTDDIATSVAATSDVDADGVSNLADLCPSVPDPAQSDIDGDGVGDLCDTLNGVTIDVRPTLGQKIKVKGDVQVTILATPHFASDRQVDRTSLTFGKLGTENSRLRCLTPADVNGDTRKDLTCVFRLSRTDLTVGNVVGVLRGTLLSGPSIRGSAAFTIRR